VGRSIIDLTSVPVSPQVLLSTTSSASGSHYFKLTDIGLYGNTTGVVCQVGSETFSDPVNEGGLDNTYRLLKNIMGLWLVQQCRRSFAQHDRDYSYEQLHQMAVKAKPLRSFINLDDPRFLDPPDMPKAIQSFCRETGQDVPETKGELVRCACESMALKYREVLGALEEVTSQRIEVIHVVGGGSQNALLNQLTADTCQRPVVAGPVEATALGNLLVQVRASGELASLAEMREIVRQSTRVRRFNPVPA